MNEEACAEDGVHDWIEGATDEGRKGERNESGGHYSSPYISIEKSILEWLHIPLECPVIAAVHR